MHGVADLGRGQAALPGDGPVRVGGTHAGDPLGVVAVRAALEERERAVGEATHVVQRRLRQRLDRRQHRRERRQRRRCARREERELARLVVDHRLDAARRQAQAQRPAAFGRRGRARVRLPAPARSAPRARSPAPLRNRDGRAPSRSVSSRRPCAASRSSRRRSAGRSRASSRRSRGAAVPPRPRPGARP